MHPIIPPFILNQYKRQQYSGSFAGTALFVDISGFTALTNELLDHGSDAAETLADLIEQLFTPLISLVNSFDGIVANFGGDAFTALFPANKITAVQLLQLFLQMQVTMEHLTNLQTPYGLFSFTLKLGVAYGEIHWQIVNNPDLNRALYYFYGTPLEEAVAAEKEAKPKEIILAESYKTQLPKEINLLPKNQFWKLIATPTSSPKSKKKQIKTNVNKQILSFAPTEIIHLPVKGEFRQIISLFIEIPKTINQSLFQALIQKIFQLQTQFAGHFNTINITNRGRSLLFFWGTPTSYENDLSRALSFLLAIKSFAPFPITAGVTYNLAYAGFIGSKSHQDYTALSSHVNLAARLMNAAPIGACWLDKSFFSHLPAEFTAEFVASLPFKGFTNTQPVYRLLSQTDRSQIMQRTDLFIGRQKELAKLNEYCAPTLQPAAPIYLHGEAGIGKTYLIHHFLHQAPYPTALCQINPIRKQLLAPFLPFLADYLQFSPENSEQKNRALLTNKLNQLILNINDSYLKQEIQRADSFLAALLNLYWPNSLYQQLDAESRLQNIFSALKSFFKALSIETTFIIIIEDADQIDKDSYNFTQYLMSNIDQYPIRLILSGRTEPSQLVYPIPNQPIYLPPMLGSEITLISSKKLAKPIAPPLQNLIQERADGNPFFADQLLLYLQEENLLVQKEESWSVVKLNKSTIPTDVRSLLLARLDQLPAETKEMVQIASVLGREFNKNNLLAMLNLEKMNPSWAEMEQKMIVTPLNQTHFIFQHALLRDVAYEMQLPTRRKQLHYQAAKTMEQLYGQETASEFGTLAYHFQQAESIDETVFYFKKAAETAEENYQNELALTYYNQLFTYATTASNQLPILLAQGEIHQILGNWEESLQCFKTAELTAIAQQNNSLQADIKTKIAHLAELSGRYPEALSLISEALHYYKKTDNPAGKANSFYQLASVYWRQNKAEEALEYYKKSLSFEQKIGDQFGISRCLNALGNIFETVGNYKEALDYYTQALELDTRLNHKPGIARVLGNIAIINRRMGNYEISIEQSKQSLAINQELGNKQGIAITLSNLGVLHRNQNQLDLAEEYYQKAKQLYQEMDHQTGLSNLLNNLGVVYKHQGNYEKAISSYQQSLDIALKLGHQRSAAMRLNNLGDMYILKEEYAIALSYLEQAVEISHKINDQRGLAIKLNTIAELKFKQKRYVEAADYNAQAIDLMEQNQEQDLLITALYEQAEIWAALNEKEKAYTCLQQGISIATQIQHEQQLKRGKTLILKLDKSFNSN